MIVYRNVRLGLVTGAFALLLVVAAVIYYKNPDETVTVQRGSTFVIRTRGGMLELSTIKAAEVWHRSQACRFLWVVPCGKYLTDTKVVAHYTYRIALAPQWQVKQQDGKFEIVLPKVEPSLPVAMDTATLSQWAGGTWSLITGNDQKLEAIEAMSGYLKKRATSKELVDLQREFSRLTAAEFARKWLIAQTEYKNVKSEEVRIRFADEP